MMYRRKKPDGKPENRCDAVIRRDALDMLHIRNWKAAARKKEGWRKEIEEIKVKGKGKGEVHPITGHEGP
jgi:hypothetical protein